MTRTSLPGEFGLIEEIRRLLQTTPNKGVVLGLGDDAAVVRASGLSQLVLTVDALVEGVHFDFRTMDCESLGWKAMAVNLSDIAAMGAVPRWSLVQLTVTRRQTVRQIRAVYRGLKRAGERFGCVLLGGNTSRSDKEFSIGVTLIGESKKPVLTRSGARIGDVIAVTGDLGASSAGLARLARQHNARRDSTVTKHLRPVPRVDEVLRLRRANVTIHACIDISDGLSSELHHIAAQSKRGMAIEIGSLPVGKPTVRAAEECGLDARQLALHGGEEYELLMTMPPKEFLKARRLLKGKLTAVGTVIKQRGVYSSDRGSMIAINARGYVHF